MILGKVIGNVVSTIKLKPYEGKKILIVKPINPDGTFKGKIVLAVDSVQAGIGDTVIIVDEGGSATYVLGDTGGIIRTVIVGIVDEIDYT